MPMNTAEFKRLKDLLMRAAATDSDAELVQCFKRASVLLATHGYTWAGAMDRVVRVVDPVEVMEEGSRTQHWETALKKVPLPQEDNDEEWDRLFEDAMAGANGGFLEMLEDIHEKWQKSGWLSNRQKEVVRKAAERYAERQVK